MSANEKASAATASRKAAIDKLAALRREVLHGGPQTEAEQEQGAKGKSTLHVILDDPQSPDLRARRRVLALMDQAEGDAGQAVPAAKNGGADEPPSEPQDWGYSLDQMNRQWALVLVGGQAVMAKETPDAPIEDRLKLVKMEAFRTLYSNRPTQVMSADGKLRTITWAKRWEGEKKRRQYEGLEFFPNPDGAAGTPGYLNLWRGFSVSPRAGGSYAVFRDHMLTNLCNGDEALFRWVFGWFANLMQCPRERPGTAIVVRGLMGTGKTILGEVMGSLIGAHYFQVDDPRYVTGTFNAHMASCLLLQAEEAVWAGDKIAEGRLKGLTTSNTQMIENKGIDPIRIRNYVRVMMTSNEDWVVPAGKDERRYCVLDIAPHVKGNYGYFQEMFEELDAGGREALLADLLAFDLTSVNLREIPRTQALLEQKLRALDSVDGFIFERLYDGTLLRDDSEWQPDGHVIRQRLYDEYLTAADKVGIKRRAEMRQFGRTLKQLFPTLEETRPRDAMGRKRAYVFPELAEARTCFVKAVGQPVDWPSDSEAPLGNSAAGETCGMG